MLAGITPRGLCLNICSDPGCFELPALGVSLAVCARSGFGVVVSNNVVAGSSEAVEQGADPLRLLKVQGVVKESV